MSIRRVLVLAGLLCVSAPVVFAEIRCPGSSTSLPLRLVQGTLFVVPVEVNGTGPYDFLLDTGAQVSSIDEALAAQLRLAPGLTVGITGAGTYTRTSLVEADLKVGSEAVSHSQAVLVHSARLDALDPLIHGILGETFLEHFDFLIDSEKHVLCLDQSGGLAAAMKGSRVRFAGPLPDANQPFPCSKSPVAVSAHLPQFKKPMLLVLDSGTNVPFLFSNPPKSHAARSDSSQIFKRVVDGVEQDFSVAQPQDVHIEHTNLRRVSFLEPLNWIGGTGTHLQIDGALPTIVFRRVFISYSKCYVILEPWNDLNLILLNSSHASTDRPAHPSQMVGQRQPSPLR